MSLSLAEPSSTITLGPPPPPAPGQYARNHRRSRSSNFFSDERTQGAFHPLPSLPRRNTHTRRPPTPAQLHLHSDSPSPDNALGLVQEPVPADELAMPPPAEPASPPTPESPTVSLDPSSSVPFPSLGGPLSPDLHAAPPERPAPPLVAPSVFFSQAEQRLANLQSGEISPQSAPTPPSPSYTPSSSPVTLKNGRPLKPSLKSRSHSSPHLSSLPNHTRAISAPATPSYAPKNVHFAGEKEGLEHVVLFLREQRPIAVSHGTPEETETETETDGKGGYPFPRMVDAAPPARERVLLDPAKTSLVPSPQILRLQNENDRNPVMLESLLLPQATPLVLRGTVIVRNIAYYKTVAVRFTLDDWQTISEVTCTHVNHLPSLPPPFGAHSPFAPQDESGWDRFGFQVRLEDYERKIEDRTLYLVSRFSANGQDWWDNNSGANYRVKFIRAPPSAPNTPSSAPSGATALPSSPSPPPQALAKPVTAPPAPFSPGPDLPKRASSFSQLNLKLFNYASPSSPKSPDNRNLSSKASLVLAKEKQREDAAEKEVQEAAISGGSMSKLASAAAVEKFSSKKEPAPAGVVGHGAEFEAEKAEREDKESRAATPTPAYLAAGSSKAVPPRNGSPIIVSPRVGSPAIVMPQTTAVALPPVPGSPMSAPIPIPGAGIRRVRLTGTNSPSSSSDELSKLQTRRSRLANGSGSGSGSDSPRSGSPHLSLTDGSSTAVPTSAAVNIMPAQTGAQLLSQPRRKLFTVEPMTPPSSSSEASPTHSTPSSPLQSPPPRLDRSERSYEEFLQKYCFFRGPNDLTPPASAAARNNGSAARGVGLGSIQV